MRIEIFSTIIRLEDFDFIGVLSFNQILKVLKHNKQLRFLFK